MNWLALVTAIGSLTACGGGDLSPTAPTSLPPANIAGSYNASIAPASSCSANLPVETRVLNYVANITQAGTAIQVQLSADVVWNSVTVTGTVSGQAVTFSNFAFSEVTTADGIALASTGTAHVAADGSITGALSGTFQTPSGASCTAANHQLHMVKR